MKKIIKDISLYSISLSLISLAPIFIINTKNNSNKNSYLSLNERYSKNSNYKIDITNHKMEISNVDVKSYQSNDKEECTNPIANKTYSVKPNNGFYHEIQYKTGINVSLVKIKTKIKVHDFFNTNFLGDWRNYIDNVQITNLDDTKEKQLYWKNNEGTWSFSLFSKVTKNDPKNPTSILKNKFISPNLTETFLTSNTYEWYEEVTARTDKSKILGTIVTYNFNNNGEIEFFHNYKIFIKEENGGGFSDSLGCIGITNINPNINFEMILPYSQYDIQLFKNTFKNIMGDQIVLKDVKDPIIFDYVENNNETNVKKIIKNRAKEFFKNKGIVNSKLGPISKYDPLTKEYVANKATGEILDIEIPASERGKTGPRKIKIIYQLTDPNRTCEFFENKNKYEIEVEIRAQLALDQDYSIDELVSIEPYKGSSDGYHDNFLIKEYNNCRLGINNPPNEIVFNKTNINDASFIINNANENLIPDEKFPVISKAGTILKIKLAIQLGLPENVIEETIEFNRIFTNGKIYKTHKITNKKYQNSQIKIKGDQLNLGLEIKDNKVYLYSNSKIELVSTNGTKIEKDTCFIEIKNVNVSIPSEQIKASSKWIQEEASKFLKDKNNNLIRYVGSFKIYDPFFFSLTNQMIDVYDPITLKPLGTFSKYKPFIVDDVFDTEKVESKGNASPIYPSTSEQSQFRANLGPYIMANRPTEAGDFKFHIAIKEFDQNSKNENIDDRYTKLKWVININMELLDSKSVLQMLGYKDNANINEVNEQKYFNEDDIENYRGDFANRDTGMYIPKIVWVNAYPPESFLYDPRDKNGELIVPIDADDNVISQAKYDIGYIAELNGTAFASGDYASNETFGGFEIIFDEEKFTPTGLIPYIEKYKFNKNSIEPRTERVTLSSSGYQTVDSNYDFGQIVLKRPNSNTFLYQLFRINTRNEILKYRQDLISLYGNRIGLKGQPLFIDFWDTYHGNNLKNYLLDKKLIEDEGKIKELEYSDVIQYWNIYVNDPSNYNGQTITGNDIGKFKPNLGYGLLKESNKEILKNRTILELTKKLNEILFKEGWINRELIYTDNFENNPFKIEENPEIFNAKLDLLLEQYDRSLLEAQLVDFNIIINEEYFKTQPIRISGTNKISILNNKDIDQIIDLSKYKGNTLLINSKDPYYNQINQSKLINEIANEISKSLEKDWNKIMQDNTQLNLGNYVPKENIDYKLKFRDRFGNAYSTIETAIRSALLTGTNFDSFNNDLFIDVEAIFNNQSHFMKNSFTKIINNNSNNEAVSEIENFDLSTIKANDLKINTTKDGILNEQIYWNANDDDLTKATSVWSLIKNRIQSDIQLYSRKWSNAYNISLQYGINYEIKIIKSIDSNNVPKYYETSTDKDFVDIIKTILLDNINNEINSFNRTINLEIIPTKTETINNYTVGFFRKSVNNSYLNNGINDDSNDENINVEDSDSIININNNLTKKEKMNMWWIITPLTIFGLGLISLIIVIIIRKNRRIR